MTDLAVAQYTYDTPNNDDVRSAQEHLADPNSPASCLLILLNQLSWNGDVTQVEAALPHMAPHVGLAELRNALATLGYASFRRRIRLKDLDARLLPCLCNRPNTDHPFVILSISKDKVYVFEKGDYRFLPKEEVQRQADAYFFSKFNAEEADRKRAKSGWLQSVFKRFSGSVKALLLISFLLNALAIAAPVFTMVVYDRVIGHHSTYALLGLTLGILAILSIDFIARLLRARIIGFLASRADFLIGLSTFQKILSLPLGCTERSPISSQLSRLKAFEQLREFFTGAGAAAFLDLPFVFVVLAVIFMVAGPLGFVPLVAAAALILVGVMTASRASRLETEQGQASAWRQQFTIETMMNMSHLKDSAAEKIWLERYRILSTRAIWLQRTQENFKAQSDALCSSIINTAALGMIVGGATSVISGTMSMGGLIASVTLMWKALAPIQALFQFGTKLRQMSSPISQINTLFRLPSSTFYKQKHQLNFEFYGDIRFQRVSFRYTQKDAPALVGLSWVVSEGEVFAITGLSRSGKSTILKLLIGMYEPQAGTIRFSDTDLRQIQPAILQKFIAYVPQDVDLFSGTIRENLRLGDVTLSQDAIEQAAARVGILTQILAMPGTFDFHLDSENMRTLPSGFARRLCLARALAKNTPVLLLDEPEQNLDMDGDRLIIELLESLKGICTIIMVSHRPSYLRLADKLLVIENGMQAYLGPPEDGLKKLK